MRRHPRIVAFSAVLALLCSINAIALSPGTQIVVPAAARGGPWVTDLHIANMTEEPATVRVFWLERDQGNLFPVSFSRVLVAGESQTFQDVLLQEFGVTSGGGAFLVDATNEVAVNSRIYSSDSGMTFGQGFPGIPIGQFTPKGRKALVPGLTHNAAFRTNVYGTAGEQGALVKFKLLHPSGSEMAARTVQLSGYEPFLLRIDLLFDVALTFDDATLEAEVTYGTAVVGASKVDEASGDPTTLESTVPSGDSTSDGLYTVSIFDSELYSTGGAFIVVDGLAGLLTMSYNNWDKIDSQGNPECIIQWLLDSSSMPTTSLTELEDEGVIFVQTYPDLNGVLGFGILLLVDENMGMVGVVIAEGAGFTSDGYGGCNGSFPPMTFLGGKLRPDPSLVTDPKQMKNSAEALLRSRLQEAVSSLQ